MLSRYLAISFTIATQFSCGGESAKFAGGVKYAAARAGDVQAKLPDALALSTFVYGLTVAGGSPVVAQARVPALPNVMLGENNSPLSDAALANWNVEIHLVGSEPTVYGPVTTSDLDVSKSTGMVTAQATFKEKNGVRQGTAFASFFVDAEKPVPNLRRMENTADGKGSKVYWSANDNYRVNRANTILIACRDEIEAFAPKNAQEASVLPPGCKVLARGEELFAQPSIINVGQVAIGDASIDGAAAHIGLYTEDAVGTPNFTWIEEPAEQLAQLELSTTPSTVIYTSQDVAKISANLLSVRETGTVAIHQQASEWVKYRISALPVSNNGSGTATSFVPQLSIPLGSSDGLYTYALQAEEIATQTKSNKRDVIVVRDTLSPVVTGIQVSVLEGILTPTSTVTINWTATDANKISSQSLSIRQTGSDGFTALATVAGGQNSFTFVWGDRPAKGFEIQIKAVDPAGNIGIGTSSKWTPQVFNAALLTSSVDCLFCHITVHGDLGGINFSSTPHESTGKFFTVTGKVYGTNNVPSLLAATARSGVQPNYNNSPLVMFPKNGQWPVLTAAILKPRMNGTLRLGNIMVIRNHQGNLILDGSKPGQPIVLNGEVFIEGDVVIKGSYTGIGTIYANNIYVVDDVVATKSAFPFDEDPAKAVVQAVSSIARKDDALYLGALNQVLVGNYTTKLADSCGPNGAGITCVSADPYSWISRADFEALGRKATLLKDVNGVAHALLHQDYDPTGTDERAQIEVNRVDAFIYAQRNLQWRSYANILLNGGYMAPYSGVMSTAPYRTTIHSENAAINWALNPRNGLPVTRNVIRYDYRLRVGGGGFETVKSYFDQN
ncbi:MAG: hypothetical protein FJ146_17610 [Deltaproteobacteria bacterium]|nr:hypothetical protein [Deltaproteobacteria bacterium]